MKSFLKSHRLTSVDSIGMQHLEFILQTADSVLNQFFLTLSPFNIPYNIMG